MEVSDRQIDREVVRDVPSQYIFDHEVMSAPLAIFTTRRWISTRKTGIITKRAGLQFLAAFPKAAFAYA